MTDRPGAAGGQTQQNPCGSASTPAAAPGRSLRTEAQLLRFVKLAAQTFGWITYHTRYSLGSDVGFPDVLAIHPRTGRLLVAELKGPRGRLTPGQAVWLDAWRCVAGAEVWVWYSGQEDAILAVLSAEGVPMGD